MDLEQKSAYYAAYRNTRQNYILVSTYIEFDTQYANVLAIVNPKSVFPVSEEDIKKHEWKRYNNFIASLRISGVVPKDEKEKEPATKSLDRATKFFLILGILPVTSHRPE